MSNKTILTKETYAKVKSWEQKYPDSYVDLKNSKIDSSWKNLFDELYNDERFENLVQKTLSESLESGKSDIHPAPEYVFNAFKLTSLDDLKVVIIGQDPYFSYEDNVHQAMGLSFSVPYGVSVPSSLKNIYSNLVKNGHINDVPNHGNLELWAKQGCLMLNTSLTVLDGDKNKNCHQNIWKWFTDKVIRYISNKKENIIFVLWGGNAIEKMTLIDLDKHEVLTSSHPSGLSCGKPFKSHSAFNATDHFGDANNILKKWDKKEIVWDV